MFNIKCVETLNHGLIIGMLGQVVETITNKRLNLFDSAHCESRPLEFKAFTEVHHFDARAGG